MRTRLLAALLALAIAAAAPAQPLSPAFTYQGRLDANGAPATGTYDFRFVLYDSAVGGTLLGAVLCVDNLSVTSGAFAAQLDFGFQFTGQQRFLEIHVRQDTGLACADGGGFVILSPRQNLTASPNASYSLNSGSAVNAANATQLNGQPAAFYTNAANLNAGTLPDARLSAGVDLVNAAQTIGGVKTFSAAPAFTAAGAPFSVTSTTVVTNLNADLLDGLSSAGFVQTSGTQTVGGVKTFSGPTYFNGFVGFGTTTSIGPANFVVSQNTLSYGGQYVNTTGPVSNPLYGYARAGTITGFHYTDGSDSDKWKLNLNGAVRVTINGQGDMGIGTTTPSNHLTVSQESDTNCIVAINSGSTAPQSSTLRLNDRNNAVWAINKNTSNDFSVREVGPGADRLYLFQGGNVAMGRNASTASGPYVLQVAATANSPEAAIFASNDSTFGQGLYALTTSASGRAIYGYADSSSGTNYGVYGESFSPGGYGVYSNGRFAASGTKSFQIDHPLDPQNKYLNHYCEEGPEPLNTYRGTVILDERGEAKVDLPNYFSEINTNATCTLTAVGAPMPALYVSEEVAANHFSIAGGAPGGKVYWRVEAARNDRFVRAYGAPVEQDKPTAQRGTYLQPALYDQPPEKGESHRPVARRGSAPSQ